MNDALPWSAACERNRGPILAVLREHFADRRDVLEIGSGTAQHAVYFAAAMPQLRWQCSDRAEHLAGIRARLALEGSANLATPIELDVAGMWPATRYDALFSANTLHIMSWSEVETLFARLDGALGEEALVAIYGPFNENGRYTSDSKAAFDASLRARAPHMGLRDIEAVHALAARIRLQPVADVAMPANNRTLIWRRSRPKS